MADSIIYNANEERLKWGVVWVNKGKRLGFLTDVNVAAASTLPTLLAAIDAKALDATLEDNLKNQDLDELRNGLKRELTYLKGLGKLTDVLIAALTTVNTAAAATDLRHLFAVNISDANFDRTREDFMDSGVGATSY